MLSRTGQLLFYQLIRGIGLIEKGRYSPLWLVFLSARLWLVIQTPTLTPFVIVHYPLVVLPSLRCILVRLATMPLSPIVGQWGPHPLLSLPSQQPHPRWNQTASPKNYDSRWVQMWAQLQNVRPLSALRLVALFMVSQQGGYPLPMIIKVA